MLYIILEAFALAFAISLDTLVVSIGYGTSKIKIPFVSAFIMSLFNVIVLSISIFIGSLLGNKISSNVCSIISFCLLFCVGIFKFSSEMFKIWLEKRAKKGQIKLKVFNFKLICSVITDSTSADINKDKRLSPREALTLALILSVDSIGVGLGIGLNSVRLEIFVLFTFLISLFFIPFGSFIGKKLSNKVNLSWLSGIILIVLSIFKLF